LPRRAALEGLASLVRGQIDHHNGYEWLTLDELTLAGLPCGLSLCFQFGRLKEVHWSVALPNEDLQDGWPTREAIDDEIVFLRNFLSKEFGRSFQSGCERFAWGEVWVKFDDKGFCATSGLRYR